MLVIMEFVCGKFIHVNNHSGRDDGYVDDVAYCVDSKYYDYPLDMDDLRYYDPVDNLDESYFDITTMTFI